MGMRTFLVWVMLLAGGAPLWAASAQGPATSAYDLAACVRAALKSDPDLDAVAADLAGARAQLAEAQAERYGQGEYTQLLGFVNEARGNVLSSPDNKNDVFKGLGPFTRLGIDLNIPVWTFGKLDAALRAAQEGVESEHARGDTRRAEVIMRTKQLYYGLLLSRQLSLVLHDMLDTMDKAVKKTQERLDQGSSSVTELDLLKLKTGRAKFAKGVFEIDASMELTRSALARAIGAQMGDGFDIADRKLQPVEADIAPLTVYLAEGPPRRPEARQLTSGIAAQSAKLDLQEAGYYPNLFLTAGFEYATAPNRTEQTNPFVYDDFNFIRPVGVLGIRWDLNFLLTSAKVEEARADLERLQARRREAASGLALEIRKAYGEVTQARNTIQASEEGRKAGRGLLVLTVSNFDLGIGEAEELFKGLGAYTEATTDYFRAVYDYNVALAALSKAVGQEITPLQY